MIEIVEGSLVFKFPDDWSVVKFDDKNSFAEKKMNFDEVKKVDILALSPSDSLLILEVKDFRGHAIENRHRLKTGGHDPLYVEVAKKVRDSMAILVAAHRCQDESLKSIYTYLLGSSNRKVDVILFLEEDEQRARTATGFKDLSSQREGLKRQLKPYGFRCEVLRRRTMPKKAPWSVSSISKPT